MPSPRLDWYVFSVEPQRESIVQDLMTRRGFHALAPRSKRFEVISRRRVIDRDEPIFPRYVFAEVRGPQWDQIRSMPFVHREPLAMDGKRYRLLASDVALIKAIAANPVEATKAPRRTKAGDKITVTGGPFRGFPAVVQAVYPKRVDVLVSMFGRLTPVELSLAALEAA